MNYFRLNQKKACSNLGFTLLELMISIVAGAFVTAGFLGFVVQERQDFLDNESRIEANQNLSTVMDLIGADIRQAGERISDNSLNPIDIINGSNDSADELVLRRQLLADVLPVCETISGSQSTIDVSVNSGPTIANCLFSDGDGNGVTDNLDVWQNYRVNEGGSTLAYIFDPTSGQGEFFLYITEDSGNCSSPDFVGETCSRIHRGDGGSWQNTYLYDSSLSPSLQPRIYLLEEKVYRLADDPATPNSGDSILELSINQETPLKVANRLNDLQIQVRESNQWRDILTVNWKQIESIRVNLIAANKSQSDTSQPYKSFSSEYFPRNILSR